MSVYRYKLIDRVADIDGTNLDGLVHPSRLYKYKKEALLDAESISVGSIESSQILHLSLDEIITTIGCALSINYNDAVFLGWHRIKDPGCSCSESNEDFYNGLERMYNQAVLHWQFLKIWNHHFGDEKSNVLSYRSDDPSDGPTYYLLEGADEWFRLYYADDDRGEAGFEAEQDGWSSNIDDESAFLDYIESDLLELVSEFFKANSEKLNYLYAHSVKSINLAAYDQWRIKGANSKIDLDWLKESKDSKHLFFTRAFKSKFIDGGFKIFDRTGYGVTFFLEASCNVAESIKSYIYVLEKLEATKESSILTEDEIKEWLDWYADRKKWHKAYSRLHDWWNSSDPTIPSEIEEDWETLKDLIGKVKVKIDDLEVLKADQLVVEKQGAKKAPENEKEAIKSIMAKIQKEKELLDKFGLEVRIEAKTLNYHPQRATESSLEMLEEYWKKPARKNLSLNKDQTNKHYDLARASMLEAKIRNYEDLPEYKAWFDVVANEKGQCTRQAIGFQKVFKEGAKDSAFRNAGMRFIAAHKLEPVANFNEVTLEAALGEQLRIQGKLKGLTEPELRGLIRGLQQSVRQEGLENYFFYELQNLGYEFSDIEFLKKQAYEQVGKKEATNRTLYDARQVAACLVMDQRDNKKLQPKAPPKPKAPSQVEALSITGPEEQAPYDKEK